jgi:hypothetical protein
MKTDMPKASRDRVVIDLAKWKAGLLKSGLTAGQTSAVAFVLTSAIVRQSSLAH